MLFDDRDMPWTIRLSVGWTVMLALFLVGTAFLPLGLYLSYWVRTRSRQSASFWCYIATAGIIFVVPLQRTFSAPIALLRLIV